MTSFHKWLCSKRMYCEICSDLQKATHVIKDEHGHEVVVCAQHFRQPKQPDWYSPKAKRSCAN